ncbi:hypothetical protein Zmor_002125 [Zophobas morio]|uniref:Uncharacterized protein n=1 Tax=Zophobas morio TaxID=2755281 RepID=A0AA38MPT0_9CUCU|nr:hypothetical protein Zmor_002085 [Zophobas morio]KAJ3666691.1 hypothetical protein Zmor_002125 [Zophobas morio]
MQSEKFMYKRKLSGRLRRNLLISCALLQPSSEKIRRLPPINRSPGAPFQDRSKKKWRRRDSVSQENSLRNDMGGTGVSDVINYFLIGLLCAGGRKH